MVDKNPSALTAVTTPLSRTAVTHFVDGSNSRKVSVSELLRWERVATWTYSTPVANVDFTSLGDYTELLIIIRTLAKTVSGLISLQVSSDNGSSWYTTSGDYVTISSVGVEGSATRIDLHATNATAVRGAIVRISGFNIAQYKPVHTPTATNDAGYIAQAVAMNAVRILPSGGGNFTTSGSIDVFGR